MGKDPAWAEVGSLHSPGLRTGSSEMPPPIPHSLPARAACSSCPEWEYSLLGKDA